jgi:hypothetical protein
MVPSVATGKISSVTLPGIDPETVRLVPQCRKHYATPGPVIYDRGFIKCGEFLDQVKDCQLLKTVSAWSESVLFCVCFIVLK